MYVIHVICIYEGRNLPHEIFYMVSDSSESPIVSKFFAFSHLIGQFRLEYSVNGQYAGVRSH